MGLEGYLFLSGLVPCLYMAITPQILTSTMFITPSVTLLVPRQLNIICAHVQRVNRSPVTFVEDTHKIHKTPAITNTRLTTERDFQCSQKVWSHNTSSKDSFPCENFSFLLAKLANRLDPCRRSSYGHGGSRKHGTIPPLSDDWKLCKTRLVPTQGGVEKREILRHK